MYKPTGIITIKAAKFAEEAHFGQRRKYTDEHYFKHCERVANKASEYFITGSDTARIAAAYLHDTLEDTNTTDEMLYREFGIYVTTLVQKLSVPKGLNREEKLQWQINNINSISDRKLEIDVKIIKLADIIDNCYDLYKQDLEFAKIYYREKRILISEALYTGPSELVLEAFKIASQA